MLEPADKAAAAAATVSTYCTAHLAAMQLATECRSDSQGRAWIFGGSLTTLFRFWSRTCLAICAICSLCSCRCRACSRHSSCSSC